MTLLPFETIIIETSLTKEETISSLAQNIEPEKTVRLSNKSDVRDFEGQLRGNEFEIKRIINYRNSFLPIVKGQIETHGTGARLIVMMSLHVAVRIFMAIWFGGIGLFVIASLWNSGDRISAGLFPLGMLIFGYALTMGAYLFESYKSKKLLTDIIKGQLVSR